MANGSLILAIDEGISALYGAIGVCGDIGNLRHALNLLKAERNRLKTNKIHNDYWPDTGFGMQD